MQAKRLPPARSLAMRHPAVTTAYGRQGIDFEFDTWDLCERYFDATERVLSTDPPRLEVTLPPADGTIRLHVDADLEVTVVSR